MSSYTNQEKVAAYLKRELTADELILLDGAIEGVSEFIKNYTSRSWDNLDSDEEEDPEETTRLYDGDGDRSLTIDDMSSLTKIELLDSQGSVYLSLDDDTDLEREVIQYPLNTPVKTSLCLRNYRFPYGSARVKVTGIFSSGVVPGGVVSVASALVGKYLGMDANNASGVKRESIEGYTIELQSSDDRDRETSAFLRSLDPYRRIIL